MIVLGITGTRTNERRGHAAAFLASIKPTLDLVVVGDCPTGIDDEATEWCKANGVDFVAAGALWDFHRKQGRAAVAGPRRNRRLARTLAAYRALGDDVAFADFPAPSSKGTHQAVSEFEKLEIKRHPEHTG